MFLVSKIKRTFSRDTPGPTSSQKSPPKGTNAPPPADPSDLSFSMNPTSHLPHYGAPPAYTASPSAASTLEDPYAFLTKFDTVMLIDDSGSMAGKRWAETKAALSAITSVCVARDPDGIDVYFLNEKSGARAPDGKAPDGYYNVTSAATVSDIFYSTVPYGGTFIGGRLQSILVPYLSKLRRAKDKADIKPVNIIVITDGEPSDDPESVIVQCARNLDKMDAPLCQLGIQFFQVGNDATAKEALRQLDDDLAQLGIRDIVDTATFDAKGCKGEKVLTADGILKVVLGAVVRRLDRKPTHTRK